MANFIRGGTRIYAPVPASPPPLPQVPDVLLRGLRRNLALRQEGGDHDAAHDAPQEAGGADGNSKQPEKGDNYLSALLKLVPAEIITVYLATKDTAAVHGKLPIWFVLCLVTCFVFRAYSNLPDKPDATLKKDVQWRAVWVSTIAFFLWAFATAEQGKPPLDGLSFFEPWLAGATASLFGLLAPVLVPADAQTAPQPANQAGKGGAQDG